MLRHSQFGLCHSQCLVLLDRLPCLAWALILCRPSDLPAVPSVLHSRSSALQPGLVPGPSGPLLQGCALGAAHVWWAGL